MIRPRVALPSLILAASLLAAAPGAVRAQAPWGWRLELAPGAGLLASGHDRSDRGQWSWVGRAALERSVSARASVGAVWVGAWPSSRLAGGHEKRQHVGLVASFRPSPGGATLSGGVGVGLATVVEQDGPPERPGVGDAVISVGDTSGVGATASVGWTLALGEVGLTPRAGLLVQRVQGHTLSHGTLTLGVILGL